MSVLVLKKKGPRTYVYGGYTFKRGLPLPVSEKDVERYLLATNRFEIVKTDEAPSQIKIRVKGADNKVQVRKVETVDAGVPAFKEKTEVLRWVEKNAPELKDQLDMSKKLKTLVEQVLVHVAAKSKNDDEDDAGTEKDSGTDGGVPV